jgi:hypothetical protein
MLKSQKLAVPVIIKNIILNDLQSKNGVLMRYENTMFVKLISTIKLLHVHTQI